MHRKNNLLTLGLAVAGSFTLIASASAQTLLVPNGTVVPLLPVTGTTGVDIANLTIPFSYNIAGATETGTIFQSVYRQSDNTLDFYYSVTNNATSPDALARVTMTDFAGVTTSVAYVTGTGDIPIDATRQADGDSIGFDFGGPLASILGSPSTTIAPGTSTDVLEIATDATSFDENGQVSIIDGATTTFSAYEPIAVPEPSTWALLLGGLFTLGFGVLRRNRNASI